jgi:hypothetical protein
MPGGMGNFAINNAAQNVNGFQLLASANLSAGAASSISVSFTGRKRLWIWANLADSVGSTTIREVFNSDTGNNYYYRTSTDNAADATANGQASALVGNYATTAVRVFVQEIFKPSDVTKGSRCMGNMQESAAITTNGPHKTESQVFYNSGTQITTITLSTADASNLGTGTEIFVYGAD